MEAEQLSCVRRGQRVGRLERWVQQGAETRKAFQVELTQPESLE